MSRPTRDSAILDGGVVHGAVTLHGLPFQVIALRLPSPFARHYWGNHILFSSPAGNEMFQFPAFACITA